MQNLSGLSTHLGALLPSLIPVAIIALVLWAMARWGNSQLWALIVALLLGVFFGPDIHGALSQVSNLLK
jgi:mannose/fructose/N-acetylgalactosamine-specific phosphotransferase system component IID